MNAEPQPSSNGRWITDNCLLCGSVVARHCSPAVPDRDGGRVEFRCCSRCRTLYPAGANDAADAVEETTRQADYHRELWADVNLEQLDLLASTASQLAGEMAQHLAPSESCETLVDIGAGRGNILHALGRRGYRVRGCEPSSFLCEVARAAYLLGPDVLANAEGDTFLRRLEATGTPVDGFVIWHVLEHVREPLTLLRHCRRLGPEAMLFIELPVAQDEDIFPEHLFFPTPASLVHLATALGLTIEHLSVTEDRRLRVFYRGRANGDDLSLEGIDLEAIEADYRDLSPVFAHFVPEPARSIDSAEKAEIGSRGGGS